MYTPTHVGFFPLDGYDISPELGLYDFQCCLRYNVGVLHKVKG